MIIILGFVIIVFVVGGCITHSLTKNRAKKEPIRTVRCPPKTMTQESDARYRSVTASIGDDIPKS